jgi:hypothetical protein
MKGGVVRKVALSFTAESDIILCLCVCRFNLMAVIGDWLQAVDAAIAEKTVLLEAHQSGESMSEVGTIMCMCVCW